MYQFVRKRLFGTVVLGEANSNGLTKSTLQAVTAASRICVPPLWMFITRRAGENVIQTASHVVGISKIYCYDTQSIEETAFSLSEFVSSNATSHVVTSSSSIFWRDVVPRVGGLLSVQPLSEVTDIIDCETFKRPLYSGSIIATVKLKSFIKLLLIRSTHFDASRIDDSKTGAEIRDFVPAQKFCDNFSEIKDFENFPGNLIFPELSSANRIVAGGRGLKTSDNFEKFIFPLCKKLHASPGATRAAVDLGLCSNDLQIGQSGKTVFPELYFAVGISGAIQHVCGMKESGVIVAVNKDRDSPIFEIADYGIVGDLEKIIPELTEKL